VRKLRQWLHLRTVDMSVASGTRDYTKCIILGRSRTGSNFLSNLLNAHPQIMIYGEIFKSRERVGWNLFPASLPRERELDLIRNHPLDFLDKRLFRAYQKRLKAVGFKMFYYHAEEPEWKPVWQHLLSNKDIAVIHIKRANILKTHLSFKKAQMTDHWLQGGRMSVKEGQAIALDFEECQAAFEQTRRWEEEYDELFAEHRKLDLLYEDLTADLAKQSKRIQDFLGVDSLDLKPLTRKQAKMSLSQAISNYEELREEFRGTPWESFFVE